jgi:hypothetical protein
VKDPIRAMSFAPLSNRLLKLNHPIQFFARG